MDVPLPQAPIDIDKHTELPEVSGRPSGRNLRPDYLLSPPYFRFMVWTYHFPRMKRLPPGGSLEPQSG